MTTGDDHAFPGVGLSAYGVLMLLAVGIGAWRWHVRTRERPELRVLIIGALAGAFLGAKLAYLIAEGWIDASAPDRWMRLLTGKSVLGGLLGAFAGVEMMKRAHGIRQPTGDGFALTLPLGILLGRIGCALQGCCLGLPWSGSCAVLDHLGTSRWPAPHVEAAFQLVMLVTLAAMRRAGLCRDRLFYVYLTAYGIFRFAHEFMRDTPRIIGPLSGYHFLAIVTAATGVAMYIRRTGSACLKAD